MLQAIFFEVNQYSWTWKNQDCPETAKILKKAIQVFSILVTLLKKFVSFFRLSTKAEKKLTAFVSKTSKVG